MSFAVVNGQLLPYNELIENATKMGASIQSLTKSRDVVLIAKKTSLEQLYCFIGAILANRIPIIIPHPSNKVSKEFFDEKMRKIDEVVHPSLCICDEENIDSFSIFWPTITDLSNDHELYKEAIHVDDVAFIQLSSGTTGVPKVIEVTHKAVYAQCDEYANFMKLTSDDVIISWLPLYHDMGLIACLMLPLLKKISFVHINPFSWLSNPSLLLEYIEKYKGTHVWMPNFAFAYMAKRCKNSYDLSSMKNWISCSEITQYCDMVKFFEHFKIPLEKISNCYAMAENVFAISHSKGIKINNQDVSCGELIPGTSVFIDAPEGQIGNIMIKSSYMANVELCEYGYYNTGDLGYFYENELYVCGRSDDMIICYGKNIFPYTIENFVSNIDDVISGRVACFGVYNKNKGTQEIYLIVETNDINNKELHNKIVLDVLKNFELSIICRLVPHNTIIKTSSGKINRKATRDKCII